MVQGLQTTAVFWLYVNINLYINLVHDGHLVMLLFVIIVIFVMPGANCSIFGCGTSRTKNYQGLSIFKIPGTKVYKDNTEEQQIKWRRDFLSCVTKDREIDQCLSEAIKKDHIYICEKHFVPDDFVRKYIAIFKYYAWGIS